MSRRQVTGSDVAAMHRWARDTVTGEVSEGVVSELVSQIVADNLHLSVPRGGSSADALRASGERMSDLVTESLAHIIYPAYTTRDFLGMVRDDLDRAVTYQVSGEVVQAATAMYLNGKTDTSAITSGEMPSEHGFAWLDEPACFGEAPRHVMMRAISWAPQAGTAADGAEFPGVRIVFWSDVYDTGGGWGKLHAGRWMRQQGAGRLVIRHTCYILHHHGLVLAQDGEHPQLWLRVLWMLMMTDIVQSERLRLRPDAERRFRRSTGRDPDVRVVRFRGRPQGSGGWGGAREWSCRWMVRPHWRHLRRQEGHAARSCSADGPRCPACEQEPGRRCCECSERVTRVAGPNGGPYVKGPDGKPLRVPDATVFRV